jgi:predicted nucleotidyltransferase
VIQPRTLELALDTIVAQCAPEQIFLIGSYATGTAKASSDLDLIIVQHSTEAKQTRDLRVEQLLAPLLIPVDINVYTPAEFEEEVRQPGTFARLATQLQGKLVYRRDLGDFAALQRRWDRESSAARHQRLRAAPSAVGL